MSKNHTQTDYDTAVLDDSSYDSHPGLDQVQPVPISTFGNIARSKAVMAPPVPRVQTLARMLDVPISLVFEVGRTKITIAQMMELREGSYIDLRNVAVDVIDIRVNDTIIAEGEAISLQQRYGVRVAEIERIPGTDEGENDV